MKAYWDSSALVEAIKDPVLRTRLRDEKGVTRTHASAEGTSTTSCMLQPRTKAGVQELLTVDANDFARLPESARVVGI